MSCVSLFVAKRGIRHTAPSEEVERLVASVKELKNNAASTEIRCDADVRSSFATPQQSRGVVLVVVPCNMLGWKSFCSCDVLLTIYLFPLFDTRPKTWYHRQLNLRNRKLSGQTVHLLQFFRINHRRMRRHRSYLTCVTFFARCLKGILTCWKPGKAFARSDLRLGTTPPRR